MSAGASAGTAATRRAWSEVHARLIVGAPGGTAPLWLWLRLPALLLVAVVPLVVSGPRILDVGQTAALYALLAVGYSVVLGLCGQFSMAHAAVFGIGAYTTAILTSSPHNVSMGAALAAAVVGSALAGAVVGLPALRLRGDQLAVVTLFVGGVVQLTFQNATGLTGGLGGITDVPVNALAGFDFQTLADQYRLTVIFLVVAVITVEQLRRSRLGLAMQAIREDELVARAAGIRTGLTKVVAFAIAGAGAGAAGWLYAGRYATVTPARFDLTLSVLIAVMVLLAGPGRTYSAVVGAVALAVLERLLSEYSSIEQGATGVAIVLVVAWRSGALRVAMLRTIDTIRQR